MTKIDGRDVNPNGSATLDERHLSEAENTSQQAVQLPLLGDNFETRQPEESPSIAFRPPGDPFDPANHRKPQDPRLSGNTQTGTIGLPNTIEARKPKKPWFIRVHPDPGYRAELRLYTDDDSKRRENNSYLFSPELEIPDDLESLVRPTLVAAAITSSGVSFLYTLNVTDSSWYESGIEVIRQATERWVRVSSGDGVYTVHFPIATLDDPHFPDVPFRDYLERAFSKRLIKSLDDPIVKRLRGAR